MPKKLNSVITRTVKVRGDKGTRECQVLFDTGASSSFVSRELAELIGIVSPLEKPQSFTIADGSEIQARDGVELRFNLNGHVVEDDFIINPSSGFGVDEIILGMSTMEQYGISVDPKHHDIIFSMKSAANPGARQPEGVNMNELIKRILARMGMSDIAPELTDEDGIALICERAGRGYKAVAVPSILSALALKEEATETDARTAIEALKTLQKKPAEAPAAPAPAVTFAGVFTKLGIVPNADVTELQAINLIAERVKKPAPATAVASNSILKALAMPETSTEEEVIGAILAIQDPGNVITVDKHQELEHQHRAFRMESIIADGIRNGKAFPYEKAELLKEAEEWNTAGRDGLVIIENKLNRRHKLMPIGERLPTHIVQENGLDDATMAIAKQMGVKPETMKKYATE